MIMQKAALGGFYFETWRQQLLYIISPLVALDACLLSIIFCCKMVWDAECGQASSQGKLKEYPGTAWNNS